MILLMVLLLPVVYFFWKRHQRLQRLRALDRMLPSALFSAASFSPETPLDRVISSLEQTTRPPLNEAFHFLREQLAAGQPLPIALKQWRRRYPSELFHRVALLLESSYKSGASLSEAYKTVAEDAFHFHTLEEERRTSFVVQKYTLYAGVILVPAVLGSLFSWAPSSGASEVVWLGLHAHLFFFSLLSALYIGAVERVFSRAWLHALVFMLVSFASFYSAAGRLTLVF